MGVITAIAATAMAIGGGLSAYGQYQAGKAEKKMADYNEALAKNQAKAAELQSMADAEALRRQQSRKRSSTEAAYAMTGFSKAGTPLLAMIEESKEMEIDVENIYRSGQIKASQLRSQADMFDFEGKNALRAAKFGAVGTLLQTAGSVGLQAKSALNKPPAGQTTNTGVPVYAD